MPKGQDIGDLIKILLIALLQHNLLTTCSENTISEIKNLKEELNSIYDTGQNENVKQKN